MAGWVEPIICKLESIFSLSDEERAAVEAMPIQVQDLGADHDVVQEGSRPSRSFAILEGYACTFKVTRAGKRQIVAFHIPGDLPDLQSLHLSVLDAGVTTLTPCKVGFVQHDALKALFRRHPRLGEVFWRETLIDAAIFREWMMSIGQHDAYTRIAHLLCEWVTRMNAVALVSEHACDMPVTQQELADALGISTVHVNRVLQELRSDGLIVLKGNKLTVLDWDRLRSAGDFDPGYLHLRRSVQ
jgi:CRP-like cAMP-binding protein